MVNTFGIYKTKSDEKFFFIVTTIDTLLMFFTSITLMAHSSIADERVAAILATFNLFYAIFGLVVLMLFNQREEVQAYENYVYASSRQAFNFVNLFALLYLIIVGGFWIFGDANRTDFLSVFVLNIISCIYMLISFYLLHELKKVTLSNASATDDSNYLESNCKSENNKKEKVRSIKDIEALQYGSTGKAGRCFCVESQNSSTSYLPVSRQIESIDDVMKFSDITSASDLSSRCDEDVEQNNKSTAF